MRYLKEIRPVLLGRSCHDGLWASFHGFPLGGGRLYDIVRARIIAKFGKAMAFMTSVGRQRPSWRWTHRRRLA